MRAMHEATRLLSALADEGEPELLRRWLKDEDNKWVRPAETRKAQENQRARLRESMEAAKQEAEAAGDEARASDIAAGLALDGMREGDQLLRASRQIYDVLSRIAHSRRSGVKDAVSAELRRMATGPHPDPVIRAQYVEYTGHIVEEAVLHVGDALGRFHGRGWFTAQVKPLIESIQKLRVVVPLDFGQPG